MSRKDARDARDARAADALRAERSDGICTGLKKFLGELKFEARFTSLGLTTNGGQCDFDNDSVAFLAVVDAFESFLSELIAAAHRSTTIASGTSNGDLDMSVILPEFAKVERKDLDKRSQMLLSSGIFRTFVNLGDDGAIDGLEKELKSDDLVLFLSRPGLVRMTASMAYLLTVTRAAIRSQIYAQGYDTDDERVRTPFTRLECQRFTDSAAALVTAFLLESMVVKRMLGSSALGLYGISQWHAYRKRDEDLIKPGAFPEFVMGGNGFLHSRDLMEHMVYHGFDKRIRSVADLYAKVEGDSHNRDADQLRKELLRLNARSTPRSYGAKFDEALRRFKEELLLVTDAGKANEIVDLVMSLAKLRSNHIKVDDHDIAEKFMEAMEALGVEGAAMDAFRRLKADLGIQSWDPSGSATGSLIEEFAGLIGPLDLTGVEQDKLFALWQNALKLRVYHHPGSHEGTQDDFFDMMRELSGGVTGIDEKKWNQVWQERERLGAQDIGPRSLSDDEIEDYKKSVELAKKSAGNRRESYKSVASELKRLRENSKKIKEYDESCVRFAKNGPQESLPEKIGRLLQELETQNKKLEETERKLLTAQSSVPGTDAADTNQNLGRYFEAMRLLELNDQTETLPETIRLFRQEHNALVEEHEKCKQKVVEYDKCLERITKARKSFTEKVFLPGTDSTVAEVLARLLDEVVNGRRPDPEQGVAWDKKVEDWQIRCKKTIDSRQNPWTSVSNAITNAATSIRWQHVLYATYPIALETLVTELVHEVIKATTVGSGMREAKLSAFLDQFGAISAKIKEKGGEGDLELRENSTPDDVKNVGGNILKSIVAFQSFHQFRAPTTTATDESRLLQQLEDASELGQKVLLVKTYCAEKEKEFEKKWQNERILLQKDVEGLNVSVEKLRENIKVEKVENVRLVEALAAMTRNRDDQVAIVKQARESVEGFEKDNQKQKNELEERTQRIVKLTEENQKLVREFSTWETAANKRTYDQESEKQRLLLANDALEKQVGKLKTEVASVRVACNNFVTECEELKKKNTELRAEYDAHESRISADKTQHTKDQQEIERLRGEVTETEVNSKKELAKFVDQLTGIHETLANRVAEGDLLRSQLTKITKERDTLKRDYDNLQGDYHRDRRTYLDEMRSTKEGCAAQLDKKEKEATYQQDLLRTRGNSFLRLSELRYDEASDVFKKETAQMISNLIQYITSLKEECSRLIHQLKPEDENLVADLKKIVEKDIPSIREEGKKIMDLSMAKFGGGSEPDVHVMTFFDRLRATMDSDHLISELEDSSSDANVARTLGSLPGITKERLHQETDRLSAFIAANPALLRALPFVEEFGSRLANAIEGDE